MENIKIMKIAAVFAVIFVVVVIIFMLIPTSVVATVDDQLSLGNRYLEELDYERAIFTFEGIIETEPANAKAYINLYKAYVGMGKRKKAVEALAKGYEKTGNEEIYELLCSNERLAASCSVNEGYFPQESLTVKVFAGTGTEVYYSLDDGEKKLYNEPIELSEGFHKIVLTAVGKYTGREGEDVTYKYTVGKMPTSMEVVKYFGRADNGYTNVFCHYDGKISVIKKVDGQELVGTVDYDFNIIDPVEENGSIRIYNYLNHSGSGDFWYTDANGSIKNAFGDYIFKSGDNGIVIEWCQPAYGGYDEKILVFKDKTTGLWGVMNMLGEIILDPRYTDSKGRGMTNADEDMVIASVKGDRVLLKAVYEEPNGE